jgi:hypothetical protein
MLGISFPNVNYTRLGRIEVLSAPRRGRVHALSAHVDARVMTTESPQTTCPDGTTDFAADKHIQCTKSHPDAPAGPFSLGWAPTVGHGSLILGDHGRRNFDVCGLSHTGGLGLAGVQYDLLDLQLVRDRFPYDQLKTSPLNAAEARALRAGKRVHVSRGISIAFLDRCCFWWVPKGVGNPYESARSGPSSHGST